jgi:spore coat polysaccharide biosynthesis protein SpsF
MHTVAILQARMGSSRLPGKVLVDIGGMTMLARAVRQLRAASLIDEICVATTTADADDPLAEAADWLDVDVHRGSEHDVLERYRDAARACEAEAIVRVTADCPLLDPAVIDCVVGALGEDVDYASNTHERTYPRGLDVEALHRDTLERIARLATSAAAREHVTSFVLEQPALFRVRQVRAERDDSDLRWTVDTDEDLAVVREIVELTGDVPYEERVAAVRARPLRATNAHVAQKPWRGSDVP